MPVSAAGNAARVGAGPGSSMVSSRPHPRPASSVTPTAAQQSAFVGSKPSTAPPSATGPAAAEQQTGQQLDVKL